MKSGFLPCGLAICLAALLSAPGAMQAQTAEEIIAKNQEARGGLENWKKIESLKLTGTYRSFSEPHPFTIWRQRPDRFRFDHFLHPKQVKIAYNGTAALTINDWFEHKEPTPIPRPDVAVTLRDKDFDNILWRIGDPAVKIEYAGKEELDEGPCFVLNVQVDDSTAETWYIDTESYLEVKMSGPTYDFGRKVHLDAYFSDYRSVGGVMIPHLVEQEFGTRYRVFEVESAEMNIEIPDGLFDLKPPASTGSGG